MKVEDILEYTHLRAVAAGIIAILFGPFCCLSGVVLSADSGLTPFFIFGILYGLIILIALGLGVFGLATSRQSPEPEKAIALSIIGLVLSLLGLCLLLLIWGSFIVLPCGLFGC